MNDEDLINTLMIASSDYSDNVSLSMLLIIAAKRIKQFQKEKDTET